MVLNFVAGGAAVNALARTAGATVRVVDMSVASDIPGVPDEVARYKVRRGSGNIAVEDALSRDEAEQAFAAGVAIADEEIDAGADLLIPGDMGIGNTTPAAALIGLLSSRDAGAVTGRGTGIDDEAWMRKAAAVRDAMRRGRSVRADQIALVGDRRRRRLRRHDRLPAASGRTQDAGDFGRVGLWGVRDGRAPSRLSLLEVVAGGAPFGRAGARVRAGSPAARAAARLPAAPRRRHWRTPRASDRARRSGDPR